MPNRRHLILSLAATALLPALRATAAEMPIFYRSPGCGCCHAWTERMAAAGLPVRLEDSEDMAALSAKLGIPAGLEGCHVGEIEGYVISGHVPPDDVKLLLAQKPDARGLLVPGMPMGSPGMEAGDERDAYDVLLLGKDGKTSIFASRA